MLTSNLNTSGSRTLNWKRCQGSLRQGGLCLTRWLGFSQPRAEGQGSVLGPETACDDVDIETDQGLRGWKRIQVHCIIFCVHQARRALWRCLSSESRAFMAGATWTRKRLPKSSGVLNIRPPLWGVEGEYPKFPAVFTSETCNWSEAVFKVRGFLRDTSVRAAVPTIPSGLSGWKKKSEMVVAMK